ncbi:MAG: PKD domain-containing protein [Bacteroidia bacterium]|nr:PKD domain-containing protein [Bacteroidia bacterium]
MKLTLRQLALLLACFLFSSTLFAQDWVKKMQDPNTNFFEVQRSFNEYYNDYVANYRQQFGTDPSRVPGYKQYKRWEYIMAPRVGSDGTRFNPAAVWKESKQYRQQVSAFNAGNWTFIGPDVVPNGGGGAGRLNFVRIHPTNPDILYVGSPAGGLWKSDDGGILWTTNTDQLAQVIGCTDLAFDPVNPDIMYLATGDGDAGDTYTIGVLKSTDGGATWNTTGLSFFTANYRQMSKILVNPNDGNIILVATTGGVYRSTDAAATFTLVQTGSFKDMEFKPGDPNTVYVAGGEFYRSTDAGLTWTKTTTGLPNVTNVSRMAIAVTEADPNYVYMIVGLPAPNYGTEGFYKSTNSGVSFTKPSTPGLGTQQWYDLCIDASPTNKDEVVVGGQTDFLRSTNGGSGWNQNGGNTHVDYHDINFENSTKYYMGNDGGIYVTDNSGASWNNLSNGLAIAQMYGFGQSATNPSLLVQGWQDNGTNKFNGLTWSHILGGDGMLCFIDRTNDQNIWGSTQNGGLARSTNGGATWAGATNGINEAGAWVTPWLQDPVSANTLYAGFVNVWRSTTGGAGWVKISNFTNTAQINTLAVSPANNQVIWAAKATGLYMTSNGGTNWNTISNVPSGTITGIACSNTDPNKAWITYSGFSNTNKVFQTNDMGATWINISASIPNVPVNCITFVNNSNDAIYIGTDLGVFYKDASINVWEPFFNGLPNVIVTQLEVFYPSGKLRASTYGRGMWESDLFVPGTYPPASSFTVNTRIGCPGTALQYSDYSTGSPTSWSWTFQGGNPSTSTDQNPVVTYNTPGTYEVTLSVTNSIGTNSYTQTNYITITPSPYNAPATVGAQRCGPGVVNLSASGTGFGNLRWWDAPGGGNLLNTGSTYSPNIAATTTYWVDEDFPSGLQDFTGEFNNGFGAGAFFTANDIRGLYFDVLAPVVVNTLDVYPNSAGNRTIEILDSQGNTVIDTTIFMAASPNNPLTVNVNFTLYPGTNYFIKCRGNVDLFRNSSGAVYPYNSSLINITNSNAGSPGYYYFFYNWVYTEITCNTARTSVMAVDTCNTVGINEITANDLISINPNPGNGVFNVSFTPATPADYNLQITNALGQVIYNEQLPELKAYFSKKLDLTKFDAGVYQLHINGGGMRSTQKLVIQK